MITCGSISWRLEGKEDTILLACSDGMLREIDITTLIKTEHELKNQGEVLTYETVLISLDHTVRVPINFSVFVPPPPVTATATATATSLAKEGEMPSSRNLHQVRVNKRIGFMLGLELGLELGVGLGGLAVEIFIK
jgi:hypothetical protein